MLTMAIYFVEVLSFIVFMTTGCFPAIFTCERH
jgi:hypothetical protein